MLGLGMEGTRRYGRKRKSGDRWSLARGGVAGIKPPFGGEKRYMARKLPVREQPGKARQGRDQAIKWFCL